MARSLKRRVCPAPRSIPNDVIRVRSWEESGALRQSKARTAKLSEGMIERRPKASAFEETLAARRLADRAPRNSRET